MIKDYKGEMPKNVTTPDKAKAKKPFYRDWKFWVLTGLMTLFGACSIYGLVLGSQYVKAIERASHMIADAQSSEKVGSLSVVRKNAYLTPSNNEFDFNFTFTNPEKQNAYFDLRDGVEYSYSQLQKPCIFLWINRPSAGVYQMQFYLNTDTNYQTLNRINDPSYTLNPNFYGHISDFTYSGMSVYSSTDFLLEQNQISISGHCILSQDFKGGYSQGVDDGYQEGYDDGYSDGSDTINVNQSVKVLLPAGEENSCSVATYLDGVPDQQVILSSSSSFGAYGEFARGRNQKLRIDLTLPSGFRAFFMYVPHWTSAYPNDENYSLRQSWAVSGVTYLPTWVAKPEIYVGITSALVDDLTYNTISVAFDVDHWGDVRVGAYQQGYQDGYVEGQQDPTAYQSGYDAGKEDGYAEGETAGFNRGVAVGSSGSQSLAMMFKTAFQLPFDQLYRFLNFNLLGINFLALFTALISVSIGIIVIKKVL